MKDALPPPLPTLSEFDSHFEKLHSSSPAAPEDHPVAASSDAAAAAQATPGLDPAVAASIASAEIRPFTASEVSSALSAMQRGKSTGLAAYAVYLFRNASPALFELVAELFTTFSQHGYPKKLNTLLLLPLWKRKGDRNDPANYRGISLIHPLGRWFAKCVEARITADTCARYADAQGGFRKFHRCEDQCLILQLLFECAAMD